MGSDWSQENAERLQLAAKFLAENDELMDLLHMNLHRVEFNRYNLEVFLSVARLYRQNLEMLLDLGRINELLKSAQEGAAAGQAARALTAIDMALDIAEEIWQQRNTVLQDATSTWYETWLPRVAEANGRRHLSTLDDAKDSPPDRTIDMSYLVLRDSCSRWENGLSKCAWQETFTPRQTICQLAITGSIGMILRRSFPSKGQ